MGMYVVLEIYISVEALNADLLGLGVFWFAYWEFIIIVIFLKIAVKPSRWKFQYEALLCFHYVKYILIYYCTILGLKHTVTWWSCFWCIFSNLKRNSHQKILERFFFSVMLSLYNYFKRLCLFLLKLIPHVCGLISLQDFKNNRWIILIQ